MSRAQWERGAPTLSPEAELALAVWNFCGGWHPEALPYAFAYLRVDDPAEVIDGVLSIRAAAERHAAAQEGHRG